MKAFNLVTKQWREMTKEEIAYIKTLSKFDQEHNTFFEEKDIHCDYLHCNAGMGMAGRGKCFNKGNGKPGCPQFVDEEQWLKKWELESSKKSKKASKTFFDKLINGKFIMKKIPN